MSDFAAGPFPNGATVMVDRDARGRVRWAVFDAAGGEPVRRLYDRDAAIAFAQALPVPDGLEPVIPAAPYNVSPRAHARREALGLDAYKPVPEPADGAPVRAMSDARARSGAGPSDRKVGIAARPRTPT